MRSDGTVRLILPMRFPKAEIQGLMQRHSRWVQRQIDRLRDRKLSVHRLADDEILLMGEPHRLLHAPGMSRGIAVDHKARTISSGQDLSENGALAGWYRAEARRVLTERLEHFASRHRFQYNRVSIRDQRTRWGSCSARKNISLNWRLVQAPAAVIDYVIVHELVHIRHPNHSRAFWAGVEAILPGYRKARQALKEFEPDRRYA